MRYLVFSFALAAAAVVAVVSAEKEVCERLVEAEVVYRQEEAPRDLSGVVRERTCCGYGAD